MGKTVLILTDRIGRHDGELGRVLMRTFLYSLARAEERPSAVLLMNEGVRLACEGSEVLDDLALLVAAGVPVKACGTCLDYLGISDLRVVGEAGTMPAAVDRLLGPGEVVTIG